MPYIICSDEHISSYLPEPNTNHKNCRLGMNLDINTDDNRRKLIDCENCCDYEIKMRYKAEVLKNVNTEKKMTQKQLFANSLKPISKKANMNIICDEVKTYAPAYASGIKGDLTMLHYDPKIRFRMFNISTAHENI